MLSQVDTRTATFTEALREALREEMERDPRVFLMGEDIGRHGGIFKVTAGLREAFGPERVRDTPISELGITAAGVGAALTGMRPVVEIMFGDFITLAMDQIVNNAAKARYMLGGQVSVPITFRTTLGTARSAAAQHSQSLHAWFCHIPGLKVVIPSSPADAKGLLKTAIRDDNPVLFFEDKILYNRSDVLPDRDDCIPFGQASVVRCGSDVTVIATARMVGLALAAAEKLAQEGIDVEVVDPRTLVPLDADTLISSAIKTKRVIVLDQGCLRYGVTGEIAATIYDAAFDYLDAPIRRLAARQVPIPFSPALEQAVLPTEQHLIEEIRRLVT